MTDKFNFSNGATYERYMGKWSQLVGEAFLDWVAPKTGLRWLDVGCGNGAFTDMVVERCMPASVMGIDPSEGQLAYARSRFESNIVQFHQGDAMAQPFSDNTFDVAVMPLVIFFVPDPAKGISEMVRVVCPGGIVSAYAWDMVGGGFPYESLFVEMRAMGISVPIEPSREASRIDLMHGFWVGASLVEIESRVFNVKRTFNDFNDYWTTVLGSPSVGSKLAEMSSDNIAILKKQMRSRLPVDSAGQITYNARANAIKGRLPS